MTQRFHSDSTWEKVPGSTSTVCGGHTEKGRYMFVGAWTSSKDPPFNSKTGNHKLNPPKRVIYNLQRAIRFKVVDSEL